MVDAGLRSSGQRRSVRLAWSARVLRGCCSDEEFLHHRTRERCNSAWMHSMCSTIRCWASTRTRAAAGSVSTARATGKITDIEADASPGSTTGMRQLEFALKLCSRCLGVTQRGIPSGVPLFMKWLRKRFRFAGEQAMKKRVVGLGEVLWDLLPGRSVPGRGSGKFRLHHDSDGRSGDRGQPGGRGFARDRGPAAAGGASGSTSITCRRIGEHPTGSGQCGSGW